MCGIVGYSGARNAVRVLLEGLSALNTAVMIPRGFCIY